MLRDVLENPEVGQGEARGSSALGLGDRLLPGDEIDVGRRCRSEYEARRGDPHARRVAGVERSVVVQHRDVVAGVPGAREALEPEYVVADDVDVLGRYGDELTPQRIEAVAVEPTRARLELAGVVQMRGSDLRDVNPERGIRPDEGSGGTRVVEVDVGEKQMPDLAELEALVGQTRLECRQARGRAAVVQRRSVVGLDQIDADRPARTLVEEVDRSMRG